MKLLKKVTFLTVLTLIIAACGNTGYVTIGDKVLTEDESSRLSGLQPQAQQILDNYADYENPEEELIKLLKKEFGDDYTKYYEANILQESASNSRATQIMVNKNLDFTTEVAPITNGWVAVDVVEWKWAWASYVKAEATFYKNGLIAYDMAKLIGQIGYDLENEPGNLENITSKVVSINTNHILVKTQDEAGYKNFRQVLFITEIDDVTKFNLSDKQGPGAVIYAGYEENQGGDALFKNRIDY